MPCSLSANQTASARKRRESSGPKSANQGSPAAVPAAAGVRYEAAEGAVDVKPQAFGRAQISDGREIVDRSDIDRTRRRDDHERLQAAVAIGRDHGAHRINVYAPIGAGGNTPQRRAPHSGNVECSGNAAMDRG